MFTVLNAQNIPGFQKINIKSLYSIQVPSYLNSVSNLNNIASLQYNNPSKEVYVIVIDESIQNLENSNLKLNLSIYFKMASFNIASGLKNFNIKNIKNKNKGNLQIIQAEFDGVLKNNNVGIYYKVAIIKSPTHFYQIFTWTLVKFKNQYTGVFQNMIDSFEVMKSF